MEPMEYSYIRRETLKLTGVDLAWYKGPQVQRRLAAYLQRSGQPNWPRFFRTLSENQDRLRHFKDYLTINVSAFFRDPDKYETLSRQILPALLEARPTLRLWSAGCACGQEPYSLGILLAEQSGAFHRHQLLATDLDGTALARAKAGGPYTPTDLELLPPALMERYFTGQAGSYWVVGSLQRRVEFRQHNLLADSFERQFDLIVCRNVVIYFTSEVKEQLYRRFYDALRPGGVLFVGGTEVLPRSASAGFEVLAPSFYRRMAD